MPFARATTAMFAAGSTPSDADTRGGEVLQQVAVVAGDLGDQAVLRQAEPSVMRVGVALGVLDPGVE